MKSHIWIEGRRVSAVKKGLAKSMREAFDNKVFDQSWNYDFGRLYAAVCPPDAKIGRSSLFGSRPPADDSLWDLARKEGFEVEVFDRNFQNKEKGVDGAIITQIMGDSYEHMKAERGDRVVLVAGDRDYVPTIQNLAKRDIKTKVVFWSHAVGNELVGAADEFLSLDDLHDYLTKTP